MSFLNLVPRSFIDGAEGEIWSNPILYTWFSVRSVTGDKLFYYMAESVFVMRLVNLRSVSCYTDQNFKRKCSFRRSKSLYLGKNCLNKVIRRMSTLRTWMLTLAFNILNCVYLWTKAMKKLTRNLIEEDSSQCLKILSQYTVKKTKIDWQRFEMFCLRENE